MDSRFADAVRAARRGDGPRHRVGAAIYDRRGRLLSVGWNHLSADRLASTAQSMHAEHHALRRCPDLSAAHRIVVACLTRGGRLTCAAPCPSCAALIERHGLVVEHTDWFVPSFREQTGGNRREPLCRS